MRLLPLIILLTSSLLGLAKEDFPVLSLQRKKWEEARITAQAKVDKSYLLRLQELKKDSVKKGDLDAARAFDKAIKGEAKGDEEEPASLTKMRTARAKALEDAFKPVDKQYWEDLKLLKGYTQRQGDLEKMEVVIAEINKVMAPYANQNKASQKDANTSLFTKPRQEKMEEISLTKLEPNSLMAGGVEEGGKWWRVHTPLSDKSVKVGGLDCKSFIFAHAPSRATYKVPSFAKFFSAIGSSRAGTSYKFIITIDGEVIFESESIGNYKNNCVPIIVEIPEGSKVIELLVDEMGSMNNDNSAWANPMFRSKNPTPRQVLSLK